jgi:hypothetical protein
MENIQALGPQMHSDALENGFQAPEYGEVEVE